MTFVSRQLLLSTGMLALLIAPAWSPPGAGAAPAAETLHREFPLAARARLSIQNGRGDITIDTSPRRAIELMAVKTVEPGSDPVAIDISDTSDAVVISSRAAVSVPASRTKVDYRLRVPADTDLKLIETARGRVQITGITGRAIVHVENGPVRIVEFAGTLDASATNGDVEAIIARAEPDESIKLETFNGDIRLRLPRTPAPHFEVRTLNGKITSQLPLTVESLYGPQIAHGTGAPGAPFVNLVSVTGDIQISRR